MLGNVINNESVFAAKNTVAKAANDFATKIKIVGIIIAAVCLFFGVILAEDSDGMSILIGCIGAAGSYLGFIITAFLFRMGGEIIEQLHQANAKNGENGKEKKYVSLNNK